MAKITAEKLKKGDKILLADQVCSVENIEVSALGKQGAKKCRLEIKMQDGEKAVIIRPADYMFDTA